MVAISERLAVYEAAIKEAKGKGESSKVRRYTRAAETIKSLQKKVCRDLCGLSSVICVVCRLCGLWSVWSVVCGLWSVVCVVCRLWSVVNYSSPSGTGGKGSGPE